MLGLTVETEIPTVFFLFAFKIFSVPIAIFDAHLCFLSALSFWLYYKTNTEKGQ